ncbi:MAG: pitrilysin family protein [bacterium]|nr:pitrilysin family protein [bacterium]
MFSQHKLSNGTRVILAPFKDSKAVTALVLVKVGSRYETARTNGLSHVLEHMMFKGTKKWPTSLSISHALDSIGAEYNAFTSKDHTGYYIKASEEEMPLVLEMLSELLLHATLSAEELEREKNVIVEEIHMYEDNPMAHIGDVYEELLYGGSKLGWLISGSKETVMGMTQKDMLDYRDTYYHSGRVLVGVAGNVNEKTLKLVEKYFRVPKKPFGQKYEPFVAKQTKPRVKVSFKETTQVHMTLGFYGFKHGDKRLAAAQLLHVILGGNMSSRLFIAVRERLGLAYYVRSGLDVYEDTGGFSVSAGLDASRIELALTTIIKELALIRDKGVTAKELDKAKHYMRGHTTLALEETSAVVDWYAKQALFDQPLKTPEQKLKEVFAVTREQVQAVAHDLIDMRRANLAMIGPFKDEEKFLKLLR